MRGGGPRPCPAKVNPCWPKDVAGRAARSAVCRAAQSVPQLQGPAPVVPVHRNYRSLGGAGKGRRRVTSRCETRKPPPPYHRHPSHLQLRDRGERPLPPLVRLGDGERHLRQERGGAQLGEGRQARRCHVSSRTPGAERKQAATRIFARPRASWTRGQLRSHRERHAKHWRGPRVEKRVWGWMLWLFYGMACAFLWVETNQLPHLCPAQTHMPAAWLTDY
jgi:hypothetical protein